MSKLDKNPIYLSQGINYLGFLSQQLGDLQGIRSLAHELIQNADDAKDESGLLAARKISFDVTDQALIVSNDALFRDEDFERLRNVASGTKRYEEGERTTGAFGVGFISVYQITDHPEIVSADRRWLLRPEEPEDRRITEYPVRRTKGTLFRLPWAFTDSEVRQKLRVPPVERSSLDSFTSELKDTLPQAILFLKSLEYMELRRNGHVRTTVRRLAESGQILIEHDGESTVWLVLQGRFGKEASDLKERYQVIERNRKDTVEIAIPDSPLHTDLLFATLPTEQSTGLSLHINADFFPDSDRKSIVLSNDYRSEWNRAAIRAAAATFSTNITTLREWFSKDHQTFWFILERINRASQEHADDARRPFGEFWRGLADSLRTIDVIFTSSGKWEFPEKVRIPTGREEEESVPVFTTLGIETVHSDLRRYRNILTSTDIGIQTIGANDLFEAFKRHGLVDYPISPDVLPRTYRSQDGVKLLWRAIDAVMAQSRTNLQDRESLFKRCSVAPCTDGRLWPFNSVYIADDQTIKLFHPLLPDVPFLIESERDHSLMNRLCHVFTAADAVRNLSDLSEDNLNSAWQNAILSPSDLLDWFETRSLEFADVQLRTDAAYLAIFPSGDRLRPLNQLALPGNFTDPLGLSELVDVEQINGHRDFLKRLGAKELTFTDYAKRYIPKALALDNISTKMKRDLLLLLARNIGLIREDQQVRDILAASPVVECEDGGFRMPKQAYLQTQEVVQVLGKSANYARINTEGVDDLYKWLGVASHPRPTDVISLIDGLIVARPAGRVREQIVALVKSLGTAFNHLRPEQQGAYAALKTKAWLPAETDLIAWHQPIELHASFQRHLYETQASWLDVPRGIQQDAAQFLQWVGVNPNPSVTMVIRHLMKYATENRSVNPDVYRFLNERAEPQQLQHLRGEACLHLGGRYLRPEQVFWGSHPFGSYRVTLGPDLQRYSDLLNTLGVKQSPTYTDALGVLKEVAANRGNNPVGDDYDVIISCWNILSEALQSKTTSEEEIHRNLHGVKCVPNRQNILSFPHWMFFEDRPGLTEKFEELLRNNTIPRHERAWSAMVAAGVRPISEAIVATLVSAVDPWEDEGLRMRVRERRSWIKSISEGSGVTSVGVPIPLEDIRFIKTSQILLEWKLSAFNREVISAVEDEDAYLHRDNKIIYFAMRGESIPWSAISRELAQAIVPGAEVRTISPGIKTVLAPDDEAEVQAELNDLGISSIHELSVQTTSVLAINDFDSSPDLQSNEPSEPFRYQEVILINGETTVGDDVDNSTDSDGYLNAPSESQTNIFAERLFEAQALTTPSPLEIPVELPPGGPNTDKSAARQTSESLESGRLGDYVQRSVTWWKPRPVAERLAQEFRQMVYGDYSKRCQICSRTFSMHNGEHQTFVVHLVEPSKDPGTNHFGNLASLCGWHYALVQYGSWTFIDPHTNQPPENPTQLRELLLNPKRQMDEVGNEYYSMPIRFLNIYDNWASSSITINEELRYSTPHWKYLRELLLTGQR